MTQALINSSVSITPHASTDIPTGPCHGLIASGAGTVAIVHENGSITPIRIVAVATAGDYAVDTMILGVRFIRINAVGTTATGIRGLYLY